MIFLIMYQNIKLEIADFFDELVAGGFLVSFAPISIFLLLKRKQNLFVYFLFIFFLAIIFFSGERANLIDFIIISVCVYFFCFKSNLFLKFFSVDFIMFNPNFYAFKFR